MTEYGGAIGVECGEPVVPGPCADVTLMPSFTIVFTLFCSAAAMLTVKCNVMTPGTPGVAPAPAFGTVRFFQVTTPFSNVPPLSADTKLVYAGSGSLTVTPVAFALPMFFSVIV